VDNTRRCRGRAGALVFAVVVAAQVAGASPQRLTLRIQVRDILEEPISGVEVRPDAGGTGGPPTDAFGETRIALDPGVAAGDVITMRVAEGISGLTDLVLLSPLDRRVFVPSPDSPTQNFATIVIARRGDLDILLRAAAVADIAGEVVNEGLAPSAADDSGVGTEAPAGRAPVPPGTVDDAAPGEVPALGTSGAMVEWLARRESAVVSQAADAEAIRQGRLDRALQQVSAALGLEPIAVDVAIRELLPGSASALDRGVAALYLGDLDAGIRELSDALELAAEGSEAEPRERFNAALFLGHARFAEGRFGAAASAYRQALAVRQDPMVLNYLGVALYRAAEYDEAEEVLLRSLALIERVAVDGSVYLATTLHNLGALYHAQGRYREAQPLYERSLAIFESGSQVSTSDLAISRHALALLYSSQGQYAEAELLLTAVIGMWRTTVGSTHPHVGRGLNGLGSVYQRQMLYPQSKPVFEEALAILEPALGADHPDVAASLNGLGNVSRVEGRYVAAEQYLRRALTIREQQLGPAHPELAMSLHDLAEMYRELNRPDDAAPHYERAISIWTDAFGPEYPNLAVALTNLGFTYAVAGRYAEAELPLVRALAIWERGFEIGEPAVANTLENLRNIYIALEFDDEEEAAGRRADGRTSGVKALYERGLIVLETGLGPNDLTVAFLLENWAAVLRQEGDNDQAAGLERRAQLIRGQ